MTAANPPAFASLLIVDAEAASEAGHWIGYDEAVAAIARGRGIATTIMTNVAFKGSEHRLQGDGVAVVPAIRRSAFRNFIDYARYGLIMEHVAVAGLGWSNFCDIWRQMRGRRYDCVFVPAILLSDVFAWALLSLFGVLKRMNRLVLVVRYEILDHSQGNPLPARKHRLWRWLFGLMHLRAGEGQIVVLADSAQLAEDYYRVCGIRGEVLPPPRTMTPRPRVRADSRAAITFGMIGLARHEKGIDLFVGAIREIIAAGLVPDARFLVQFDQPVVLPGGQVLACPPELQASPRVEILDHALSAEEYEEAFKRIDCMVLPYRREKYVGRTSGVAVEAACADLPMIYTANSWLDVFASEQGAGLAVPSDDQAAVRDAIIAMTGNWSHYSNAAEASGKVARARNGGDAFLTVLLGRPLPPLVESHVPHGHERCA